MEKQKSNIVLNKKVEIKHFSPLPVIEQPTIVSIDKALDVDKVAITPVKVKTEDKTIKLAKDYKVEDIKSDESSISISSSKYEDKGN